MICTGVAQTLRSTQRAPKALWAEGLWVAPGKTLLGHVSVDTKSHRLVSHDQDELGNTCFPETGQISPRLMIRPEQCQEGKAGCVISSRPTAISELSWQEGAPSRPCLSPKPRSSALSMSGLPTEGLSLLLMSDVCSWVHLSLPRVTVLRLTLLRFPGHQLVTLFPSAPGWEGLSPSLSTSPPPRHTSTQWTCLLLSVLSPSPWGRRPLLPLSDTLGVFRASGCPVGAALRSFAASSFHPHL